MSSESSELCSFCGYNTEKRKYCMSTWYNKSTGHHFLLQVLRDRKDFRLMCGLRSKLIIFMSPQSVTCAGDEYYFEHFSPSPAARSFVCASRVKVTRLH